MLKPKPPKPPTLTKTGKKVGRPRLADNTGNLALRAPLDVVEAIDRYAADLAKRLSISVSRNDAMRRLLIRGLVDAGFLQGTYFPDGLNVGKEERGLEPEWKTGAHQYRSPPLLHPMPDPDQHPEWWDDATKDEE